MRGSERVDEQIVDVPLPQMSQERSSERIVEVAQIIFQEVRSWRHIVIDVWWGILSTLPCRRSLKTQSSGCSNAPMEQIVDVPVPQVFEDIVKRVQLHITERM